MRIELAGSTHVGMRRGQNEDSFLLLPEANLCVVADGMGGHASGEVASRTAVDAIELFFRTSRSDRELTWPFAIDESRPLEENRLLVGIRQANAKIYELSCAEPKYRGMGTTLVSLVVSDGVVTCGWAGDSRCYRLRAGVLEQLSEDHSLVNELLKANKLRPEDVESFPHRNVISRALGMKDDVEIDLVRDQAREGDLYLLCSDGLSGMVSDERIAKILCRTTDLDRAAQQLIDTANAMGGADNITVALARIA